MYLKVTAVLGGVLLLEVFLPLYVDTVLLLKYHRITIKYIKLDYLTPNPFSIHVSHRSFLAS